MTDKNAVIERLSRRDAQRIEKLQKAQKARVEVESTNENEDYFATNFKIKSEHVEDLLTLIPTLETHELPTHFDHIKKETTELQKFVCASTMFLTEFNIRKYFGIVQNLQTKCYELEDRYVPRKKFGFNKKKHPKPECQKQQSIDEQDSISKKIASKWEDKIFGFDTKENEVLSLQSNELFQRDVTLRHLKNCTIGLKGVLGTLHMSDLEDCIILCGPVLTSVFLERCTKCTIVVACQQLRMHTSTKCIVYLHVTSKGVVEDCSEIKTAPYNLRYDELDSHFVTASLDKSTNNWNKLDDFNWLAPDVPSPNWSILDAEHRISNWDGQWNKTPK